MKAIAVHGAANRGGRVDGRIILRGVIGIAAALALAGAATAVQLQAQRWLEFRSQFSFFYLAILISALLWGTIPGVITAVASALLSGIYILTPRGALLSDDPVDWTELLLFAIVSTAIIVVVRRLQRARERSDRLGVQASEAADQLREEVAVRLRAEKALARQRDTLEATVRERTAELEASHERMRLSERMAAVGGLAAGVAHDLANLIMPMQMRLRALAARPLDEQAAEDVRAVGRCVDYLTSLATGLRLFARDPGKADRDEVTHPGPWLRDTAPFFRNVLPAEIELTIDVPDDLPDIGVAPHRLTQAMINLIGNARDAIAATGKAGTVTVRARREGDRIRLDVSDNGPGMSEEVRRRCLEPYFTTRGQSGTGLGLALVHDIARSAGGEVEIDSAPGRGARISLTLPVAAATATVGEASG